MRSVPLPVRSALAALAMVAVATGWTAVQGPAAAGPDLLADGRLLYVRGCASCHGPDGRGTDRGPSLEGSGAAGAYYYLSTGRMPMADPEEQPERKPPAYDGEELRALVAYVASLGDGPAIPVVDPSEGDLAVGGLLYRENCAPCHSAAGIGGALSYGQGAPSLGSAEPVIVATAMRIGPGQMPVFGPPLFDDEEVASIARYTEYIREPPSPGGASLGGAGPIPEGFVIWLFGLGTLLVATLWIGGRRPPADRRSSP